MEIILKLTEIKDNYLKQLENYMNIEYISKISKTVIGKTTQQNLKYLKSLPFVQQISYNIEYKPQFTYIAPEKPVEYLSQEGKFITNYQANQYHNPVNDLTGKNIKIAVLDTGINYNHPLLKGKIIKNIQITEGDITDKLGHGTWIAGTLVARPKEISIGLIKGVCPDSKIINIKVLNDNGIGKTSYIIKGLDKAIENNCKIANLSLATPVPDPLLTSIMKDYAEHITICCAAGNFGNKAKVGYPASSPYTIAVGSVYPDNKILKVSNFSPQGVDIVAVGGNTYPEFYIVSTAKNTYLGMAGTSMATPYVTGAIALLLQKYPNLTPKEILNIIRAPPYQNPYIGHGLLNIKEMINLNTNKNTTSQQNPIPILALLLFLLMR